jgi:ABC-2 type transport system permease protein
MPNPQGNPEKKTDRRLMVEQAWLVASREYRERVRSRAFLLTTLLTPIFLGAILGGSVVMAMHANANQRIAVASNNATEADAVADELRSEQQGPKAVDVVTPADTAAVSTLNRRITSKSLSGYLLLTPAPGGDASHAVYVSSSSADMSTAGEMSSALTRTRTRSALLARGIAPTAANTLLQRVDVETEQLRDGRAVASNNFKNFGSTYALVMLLSLIVLIYGMNVARSVIQEKTSRIYEVLLSTARSDSLMWGKLLGVGAAGLTQVGIWFVLLSLVAGTSIAASYGLHGISSLGLRPAQLIFFVVFFVLGFLYYSGISAALGAMVGAEQEVQQLSIVVVAPLVFAVIMMSYVLANPSSTVSVVLSLIPPLTPIIMYLRICAQTPPAWQIALSVFLLVAAIAIVVWIASRIYRIGILMYGKRPTLPEIARWLRAS